MFVAQSTNQTQNTIFTQNQLKEISTKTAAFITSTQTISDSNFYLELKLNKIKYTDSKGNNKSSFPEIAITDGNKLRVWLNIDGTILDANDYFGKGKTAVIKIDEVNTFGKLVIRSA
jgi:hypothetical protein